jgi:D-arabinose 1-dehydrogenase-like Zn-dependent alcohol dehydrogenase
MFPLVLLLVTTTFAAQDPGTKKVPDDSVQVSARGCLKGRVFAAAARTEEEGVQLGPEVGGRSFRIAAPKAVMNDVKKHNGHWVAIVGIVRKSDLSAAMLGPRVGGTRVIVGQPGRDPSRSNLPTPAPVPVMDVSSVQFLGEECPIR